MDLYFAVLKKTFQQQFMYRSNTIFYIIGSIIRVVIQISIWKTLLGFSGSTNNLNIEDMIAFTVISLILRNFIQSDVAYALADKVDSGAIALDLIKPVNLKAYMFSEQLSANFFNFLFTSVPVLFISIIFFNFTFPHNALNFIMFIISLIFAIILMYFIDFSLGLLVFWIKKGLYIDFISGSLFQVFSGASIPLWFYPKFLSNISYYLPFRLIAFDPISIYLEKINYVQSAKIILLQLMWIVLFYIFEKFLWKAAQKMVFVQGG